VNQVVDNYFPQIFLRFNTLSHIFSQLKAPFLLPFHIFHIIINNTLYILIFLFI